MEYPDAPISNICWKTQYGEPLTDEEAAQLVAWQKANPGKTFRDVVDEELAFDVMFERRRELEMVGVFQQINDAATEPVAVEPAEVVPVIAIRQRSWYQRPKVIIIAAATIAGLVFGLVGMLQSVDEKAVSGQPEAVAQTPVRQAPSDTVLYVSINDANRIAVGNKDTGLVSDLGSVLLYNKGYGQLVYKAVGTHEGKALTNHRIISVPRKLVTVQLADQSIVELGPQSSFQVNVDGSSGERSVTLTGIAQFTVTHDAQRPFIVQAAGVPVQVLGTTFAVMTGDRGYTTVGVKKGSVRVGSGSRVATLKKGQAVQVSANGIIRSATGRYESLFQFTKQQFYYKDQSLATIKADIEQWYGVQLIDDNPSDSLATYYFGPLSRDLPLTTVLERLGRSTNHRFRYQQRP